MHLQDIPRQHVPALAEILQFRPDEDTQTRAERISKGAKSLPSSLRPSRLERLLLPPSGYLCKLHKGLDDPVVHVVLHRLQFEVGYRLNNLVSQCQLLTNEQFNRVMRLRTLHALQCFLCAGISSIVTAQCNYTCSAEAIQEALLRASLDQRCTILRRVIRSCCLILMSRQTALALHRLWYVVSPAEVLLARTIVML